MSQVEDYDEILSNPFEDEPAETTEETTEEVTNSTEEATTDVEETVEEAEAEQTATEEESETEESTEESKETEVEEESSESQDDHKPTEDAPNAEWAKWRREQKELKAQQDALRQKQYQEYIGQADNDDDLRLRQIEVDQAKVNQKQYEDTVANNEKQILLDHDRVLSDPDTQMFNPDSKTFNQRQFARMQASYEAIHVKTNPNRPTDIMEVNESFYKFAKDWAKDWQLDAKVTEAKATKTAVRNISKSEPSGNSVSKPPKESDPLEALWDSDE